MYSQIGHWRQYGACALTKAPILFSKRASILRNACNAGGSVTTSRRLAARPHLEPIHSNPIFYSKLRHKSAKAWRWPPTPFSAKAKEKVELYLYFRSGPARPVPAWIFNFTTSRSIGPVVSYPERVGGGRPLWGGALFHTRGCCKLKNVNH